ncbi:uncharacterized protein PFL1_03190 [Pseudozyma flocculosa PF-1]|uniref:Protection of telomeres protein 1 n=1 Tax=Pseudozyma flocculosa PF-1 TaxID=1277687 RepID=A0A061HBM4_9BASI|nr:uncharacterized protein PFL1_03190 [Pseudozyma flocculosa PF-1]EPQ29435.1 hypothetical protein PFL1_03190 [Pseudozyma flocculosa PF-1]
MPRKKKSLKRETSDIVAAPTAAASLSTAPEQHPEGPAAKRPRILSDDDEDRLGRLVDLPRWCERVGQGRGAAVCLYATLVKIALSTTSADGSACHLDLECPPIASDPSAGPSKLCAAFYGPLAEHVFRTLGAVHRRSPPAHVHLSGFAATFDPSRPERIEFRTGKAVLRFRPTSVGDGPDTEALWVERLDRPGNARQGASAASPKSFSMRPPLARPASSRTMSSGASDGWFDTPAPQAQPSGTGTEQRGLKPSGRPSNTSRPEERVVAANAASPAPPSDDASAGPPQRRRQESVAAQHNTDRIRLTSTASDGITMARQTASPAPPRNDPIFQPVSTFGSTVYTSITALRNGQLANVAGVVIGAGDPRRAAGGSRDLSLKIQLVDMSCSAILNRQNPGNLTTSLTVMLFSSTMDRIVSPVCKGQVLLFRRVAIQDFNGKPQAVGKNAESWSWALYDPVSGSIRKSPSFEQAKPLSAAETDHMRSLASWYGRLQGDELGLLSRPGRSSLRLEEVSENLFFDSTVEVLKVFTQAHSPDLYVTDYTSHALFFRGTDHYLGLDTALEYPEPGDGWGHVFQIGLWDIHAEIADALKTGDIIRIENVRAKMNPRGMLVGGLGSASDSGVKIKTLKPSEDARISLERRRAHFLERHRRATEPEVTVEGGHLDDCRAPTNVDGADTLPAGSAEPAPQASKREPDEEAVQSALNHPVKESPTSGRIRAKDEEQEGFGSQRQLQILQPWQTSQPNTDSQESSAGSTKDTAAAAQRIPATSTPPPPAAQPKPPAAAWPSVTVRCKAPSSVPDTPFSSLLTTSTCPGMHKVSGRVVSVRPERPEEWARLECKSCRKLLPLEELFCARCGEEDGEGETNLRYTLRFAIMLEEVDAAPAGQMAGERRQNTVRVPILFNDQAAISFLPDIDPEKLHRGSKSTLRMLVARIEGLIGKPLTMLSQGDTQPDGPGAFTAPVVKLAIYSYPASEGGRTVRRFAGLKSANTLVPLS